MIMFWLKGCTMSYPILLVIIYAPNFKFMQLMLFGHFSPVNLKRRMSDLIMEFDSMHKFRGNNPIFQIEFHCIIKNGFQIQNLWDLHV